MHSGHLEIFYILKPLACPVYRWKVFYNYLTIATSVIVLFSVTAAVPKWLTVDIMCVCVCVTDTPFGWLAPVATASLISLESLFIKLSSVEVDQCFCAC